MKQRDDFNKRLLETFRVEAEDRMKVIFDQLLRLERVTATEDQIAAVESLFRETHSLKGAARAVSAEAIERICAALENAFSALKKKSLTISPELLNNLHKAADTIVELLSSAGLLPSRTGDDPVANIVTMLTGTLPERRPPTMPTPPPEFPGESADSIKKEVTPSPSQTQETVRVAVAKLDALRLQVEEMLSFKLSAARRNEDLRSLLDDFMAWRKQWDQTYRVLRTPQRTAERQPIRRADPFHTAGGRLLEVFESGSVLLNDWQQKLWNLARISVQDQRSLSLVLDSLVNEARQVQMFPLATLLEPFPKIVRDLAHDRGKKVRFLADGTDIEIDRRILEALKDPVLHLVRNAVDHGIESPAERERSGKPPEGTIRVTVAPRNGSWVELQLSDDGGGIDLEKVRQAAIRNGVVTQTEAEQFSDQETMALIFASGMTTSSMITDVSGRGLGLAIVRERAELLGGRVAVATTPPKGTTFSLVLPLTLATFRGVLVSAAEQPFIIPVSAVERTVRFRREEVHTIENKEAVSVNGESVALVWLSRVLGLRAHHNGGEIQKALVLNSGKRRIAFAVDAVGQEQEVLVKPLGPQLSRVRNIAGATVLGDGAVVPILNVSDLVNTALRAVGAPERTAKPKATEKTPQRSILVVEDSITARTLLKNILEGVGYRVATAVDGIDGLTQARTGEFDLVVSDVDMPRMNGFDLTAKIRSDKKLANLPVVLVTALESREDRERGVDVGANAYIVKSSFDQSNLLEIVKRLAG